VLLIIFKFIFQNLKLFFIFIILVVKVMRNNVSYIVIVTIVLSSVLISGCISERCIGCNMYDPYTEIDKTVNIFDPLSPIWFVNVSKHFSVNESDVSLLINNNSFLDSVVFANGSYIVLNDSLRYYGSENVSILGKSYRVIDKNIVGLLVVVNYVFVNGSDVSHPISIQVKYLALTPEFVNKSRIDLSGFSVPVFKDENYYKLVKLIENDSVSVSGVLYGYGVYLLVFEDGEWRVVPLVNINSVEK